MSHGATIGLDAGNNTGYVEDGSNNQHFIFLSSVAYNPGTDETVDTWQFTQSAAAATAGAGVVPLIYTASGATFDIHAIGGEETSGGTFIWGTTLTAGTDYYFGFAQEDNLVNYSKTATPGTPIPMDRAWLFGDPSALDTSDNGELAMENSGVIPGDNTTGLLPFNLSAHPNGEAGGAAGTSYTFFNEGTLDSDRQYNIQFNTTPIPEPSATFLGLLGLGLFLRRRR